MSLLTSRYALGVGPLREALSQLVAVRLGHGGESKRVSGGVYVRAGAARYFRRPRQYGSDAGQSGRSPAVAMNGRQTFSQKRICSVSWRPVTPVRKCLMSGICVIRRFIRQLVAGCGSHYLLQMRERLFDLAARYRFIWLRRTVLSVEMLEDKHDQHQTLTAAVLARDTARASELMRQHLLTPTSPLSSRRWLAINYSSGIRNTCPG